MPRCRFLIPVFLSGTWNLDNPVDRYIPVSLSFILESKAQDSKFHKQKIPGFPNGASGMA